MEDTVGLGEKTKQDYLTTFLCTQMTNVLIGSIGSGCS